MSEFERALQRVLAHEGGFSNHPKDPGGATMKGVTQATYDAWRKSEGLPPQSVKLISSQSRLPPFTGPNTGI
jgi:lysozyme family protein